MQHYSMLIVFNKKIAMKNANYWKMLKWISFFEWHFCKNNKSQASKKWFPSFIIKQFWPACSTSVVFLCFVVVFFFFLLVQIRQCTNLTWHDVFCWGWWLCGLFLWLSHFETIAQIFFWKQRWLRLILTNMRNGLWIQRREVLPFSMLTNQAMMRQMRNRCV